MIRLVFLALLVLVGAPANAQETYTVLSLGTVSCGKFLAESAKLQSDDLFWVEGFLTGANAFSTEKHAGRGTDYDARKLWLSNYCAAHPLDSLADAAQALREELINKPRS